MRRKMKIVNKKISPRYKRDNIESFLLISSKTTDSKNICITLVEMEPGGFQNIHYHEPEQIYYILEGKGIMTIDDDESIVQAGDCIFIPSQSKHGLRNNDNNILKYISASSPSFTIEECKKYWPLKSISEK
jgi:mannose-6-phosphate isomerase-like protein (cupin superfamily)